MDHFNIGASSGLGAINAAARSIKALCETVKRYRDRSKTMRRLQEELEHLVSILDSLRQVIGTDAPVLALLRGPIDRCSQVCAEFEKSLEAFSGRSTAGFRDWAKMEFMRGDINEFIDMIAGYRATISVGLGTVTLQTTKVSQQALEDYNEMIQDTAYNLEVHLRRIDEKIAQLAPPRRSIAAGPSESVDLEDERQVTEQCMNICEEARTYLETLTNRESSLLASTAAAQALELEDDAGVFEAQRLARKTLLEAQDSFADISRAMRRQLHELVSQGSAGREEDRLALQANIGSLRELQDILAKSAEISRQKVYRVGEVVADGHSDQVVATSLADLFDVRKAASRGNSAQLVGSMSDETLQHMATQRYSSRFGAVPSEFVRVPAEADPSRPAPGGEPAEKGPASTTVRGSTPQSAERSRRPSPNEVRKRYGDDGKGLNRPSDRG